MINNWNNRRHRDINPLAVIGIIIAVLSVVYLIRNRDNLTLLSADESYVANRVIKDNNEFVAIQNYSLEDIYNEICSQINEYKTTVTIVCKSESDMSVVMDLFSAAVADNPEWFWITGGGSAKGVTVGNITTVTISVDTRCVMSEVPVMAQKMDEIVNEIIDDAKKNCSTDYEMAKYVHDTIVLNCEYDEDTYEVYANNLGDGSDLAHSAYGCLVEGLAVCEGYAKAYMYVMNKLGIECGYVSGVGSNLYASGPHAWNYLKLDGDYYMVDVTWDDPIGATADYCGYDYFCITTEEILKDHTIDDDSIVPYCGGGKFSQ